MKRNEKLRQQNRCTRCTRIKTQGEETAACANCLKRMREKDNAKYAEMRKNNICTKCKKAKALGSKCKDCALSSSWGNSLRYTERKQMRKCNRCRKNNPTPYANCDNCRPIINENTKRYRSRNKSEIRG